MVRTRYAPSPTGFMHIGNLRTALFEYLIAKHDNGIFILRIEDTDQERYVDGAADAIFETLQLTGLNFDEGPGIGGEYGPYIQSERKAGYLPHAKKLVEIKKAYYCFCDKERLLSLADENGIRRYDRYCTTLSPEEVQEKLNTEVPYVIRQWIPEGETSFYDEVFGTITLNNKEMEDQVLIKSDGMPTYNFANVVDDHLMAITHVVRGSEYLTSTPKYKLLYEALDWEIPVYVHLPLLQNASGQKISKRNGDASIKQLLEMGFLPEAIINYAALLGWSPPDNREIFSLDELIKIFEPKNISKSPSTFDIVKLKWVNGEHIKAMPVEEYRDMALPFLKEAVKKPNIDYDYLARATQSRVSIVSECAELVDFIDNLPNPDYDLNLFTHKKMKTTEEVALCALIGIWTRFGMFNDSKPKGDWNSESLSQWITTLVEISSKSGGSAGGTALTKGQILWSLRTALSGKATTPCGAIEICLLLGKEESLNRIKQAIDRLKISVESNK